MFEAHAPGKLIICGEYAVLCGAPAIALAVDVRARARVVTGGGSRLTIVGGGDWPFRWGPGGSLSWGEPAPGQQGRVLEAVASTLAAHGIPLPSQADLDLDTREFQVTLPDGGVNKLGLGSSAAITVALTAALVAAARGPRRDADLLFALGAEAHRRFQDGGGSGIDVAVGVHGGVVMLTPRVPTPEVRPLSWPKGLHWLAAWSGSSAATTQLLARFDAFRAADPVRFGRQMRLLVELATAAAVAWPRQDVQLILRCLADYDDALRAFDDGAGIGIHTPEHERLARVAQAAGALYKISGAGGGDFGIAFADSAAAVDRVGAEFAKLGIRTLSGPTSVAGVVVS